jgi:hypothetical protein
VKSRVITATFAAVVVALTLVGCAPAGPTAQPTTTPSPTQTPSNTALAAPQTPAEAWESFAALAEASNKRSIEGLVEEDVAGPNIGKLKIRLTWAQAGENAYAYKLPNGDVGPLGFLDYYCCDEWFLLTYDGEVPPYRADLPLQVSFDHLTGKYETTGPDEDGNPRTLIYTIDDGVFSEVENVTEGSRTTLTYGLPDAAMTRIVNDVYAGLNTN